jgi:hypothetical protein
MNCVVLNTSELSVVIGNNEAGEGDWASHRAGYNGIWSLASVHSPQNCFVPLYAGLNLEHCMDDLFMTDEGGDIFEPRRAPMHVTRFSASTVSLAQAPTPLTGVESETLYEVVEPHAMDMRFRATLHRPPRAGRWFGFFWASYINAPDCPALHFRDRKGMLHCLSPDQHGGQGANTVCHESVGRPCLGARQGQYAAHSLAHSFSARRFDLPVMFGRPGDGSMLFLQMFDQRGPLRLCMSPSGGGANETKKVYNPAWDFQYILEDVMVGVEYRLRSRVIYKPYKDLGEIDRLYAEWTQEIEDGTQQPPERDGLPVAS